MQEVHDTTNFEIFDFNDTLNREYLIDSALWTTDMASGTIIGPYLFPKVLFDQQFIKDKIKDFRYFKGGVRFTVRVAASKFVYGKIAVGFEPISTGLSLYPNVYQLSGSPHVIVSASASEAVVFDVPFISMFRAVDLRNFDPDEIGRFTMMVMNPLKDITGAANNARVLVTAQFLEGQVFLPHDFVTESGRMSTVSKGAEGRAKSSSGHVGATLEDPAALASGLEETAIDKVTESVFGKGGETAMAGISGAMFGLSKPSSVDMSQITKINPNSDISYGKGVDKSTKIAMDPENQISTEPLVGGIGLDEMSLAYIAQNPMLINIQDFNDDSPPVKIATCDRNDVRLCHVDWLSRQFKYVSGSYKFRFYITASLMHAVRAVIYLSDTNSAAWENCYHVVVDIQGDTEVEFTVPYIGHSVMKKSGENSEFGIWMQILSWSQPDMAAVTPIYVNVYKAGADDFQFGCLLESAFVTQANPREDFAKPFEPIHPSCLGYAPKNLVCGEEYTTMREIVHRYHAYYLVNKDYRQVYIKPIVEPETAQFGLEKFGLIFRFWRGSIRVRGLTKNWCPTGAVGVQIDTEQVVGTSIANMQLPQLDAEIPFYTNALMNHNSAQADESVTGYSLRCGSNNASTEELVFLLKSAGDDFSFHFLKAPSAGYFTPVVSPSGIPGLQVFLS